MAAVSKEALAKWESENGLDEDGLTYQLRCSRMAALQKGEGWSGPKPSEVKNVAPSPMPSEQRRHPLIGKRLLITPLMTSDKNRALYFDEKLGADIEVEEASAGEMLHGAGDKVDRMVGDYKIIRTNSSKTVTAKTSLPKIGQEISWDIEKEIVPVVRGNDGQRGYVWILPTHMRQYGETMIQIVGLKTLITQIAPELLSKFSGKPMMMYVDGYVLAASIPQTDALLKDWRRRELQDAKLGL